MKEGASLWHLVGVIGYDITSFIVMEVVVDSFNAIFIVLNEGRGFSVSASWFDGVASLPSWTGRLLLTHSVLILGS